MMTQEEAYQYMIRAIEKDRKHKDYKHVTDLADKYYKLITGDKIEDLMKQFERRETEIMFDQRKTITKDISKSVCSNLMDVANKVPRSPGMRKNIKYNDDKKNERIDELTRMIKGFYGSENLDEYMSSRFVHLSYVDPNAFIVVEFNAFGQNESPEPYPFEVNSKEAVDYKYQNNVLKYLLVLNTKKVINPQKKEEEIKRYTLYLENQTIVFEQLPKDSKAIQAVEKTVVETADGEKHVKIGQLVYRIYEFLPHNIGYVPAVRVGYKDDLITNGRTFVNPFDAAVPYLEKIIKANSEFDLTMALHAFPQKIQYVQQCYNEGCNRGYLPGGEICPVCEGTGFGTIKSAQEMINIQMPRDKEEQLTLDNIIKYIYPPIDLLTFQEEHIDKLIGHCQQVVFNSDIFSRQEIAETATGKNIDLQNVYDTLYPFALRYAKTWRKIIETMAKISDIDKDLVVVMTFDKDFKFKSVNELFIDRESAERSGASTAIKKDIETDIMRINLADRPEEFHRYQIMEKMNPFSSKSRDEIIILLNGDLTTLENKIIYLHMESIIKELEAENPDLYKIEESKLRAMVEEKAKEIIKAIKAEKPEIDLTSEMKTE